MKIILIIVLIFVIMLIANAVSQQYKDKFDFYYNLKVFLNQFKINVSFKKEKIPNFINKIESKKYFGLFIDEYKGYLQNGNLNLESLKILEPEEKQQLLEIVHNLGRYNSENESMQLENYLLLVEEKLNTAKENKIKLCPMIIKLALLFGIGLAIILV